MFLVIVDFTQQKGGQLMAALLHEGAGLCQNVAPFICKGRREPEAGGSGLLACFIFPLKNKGVSYNSNVC